MICIKAFHDSESWFFRSMNSHGSVRSGTAHTHTMSLRFGSVILSDTENPAVRFGSVLFRKFGPNRFHFEPYQVARNRKHYSSKHQGIN